MAPTLACPIVQFWPRLNHKDEYNLKEERTNKQQREYFRSYRKLEILSIRCEVWLLSLTVKHEEWMQPGDPCLVCGEPLERPANNYHFHCSNPRCPVIYFERIGSDSYKVVLDCPATKRLPIKIPENSSCVTVTKKELSAMAPEVIKI